MTKKEKGTKMPEEKAVEKVAPVGSQLPAVIDFSGDVGGGFEEADASSFAIPFLRQLQSLSPACKKSDPEFIKGAEEGDFLNTVTGRLYKGETGVFVVPCHYVHKYNEWAPGRGGFRGSHSSSEYANLQRGIKKDDKGNDVEYSIATGNILQDAREHYLLVIDDELGTMDPVLMVLTASQTKKSKKWMTQMQGIRIGNAIAPMFSQIYKITSVPESNDKGSWAGIKIEHYSPVGSMDAYNRAKQFRNMVRTGAAKVTPAEGDVPF
jgi:hypothetical protein